MAVQAAIHAEETEEQGHDSDINEHASGHAGRDTMRTARQNARVFGLSTVQVKICARCGKQFPIVSPDYAYKLEKSRADKRYMWFCSYACMRAIQKPLEEKEKAEFEARVQKDILNLEECEKHNQRTLAAYHAKKEAREAAMTEEEKAAEAAAKNEKKRLAGLASAKKRSEKAEQEKVEQALRHQHDAFAKEVDRMPKTDPFEMDKERIERAKIDAMLCKMRAEDEWRKKKRGRNKKTCQETKS